MLNTIKFNLIRNAEVLAFVSNILDVIKGQNIEVLAGVTADLQTAHDNMSAAFKKENNVDMTSSLKDLDTQRDEAIQGIILVLRGYQKHFDKTKRDAADALLRSIRKYSKNVAALSYQEETATIKNIIADWKDNTDLNDGLSLLNLTDWQLELENTNSDFDNLYVGRSQADAQISLKASVSELRPTVEDSYRTVSKHIDANAILNPSEQLTTLIAEMNTLIDKYNTAVERRGSRETEEV